MNYKVLLMLIGYLALSGAENAIDIPQETAARWKAAAERADMETLLTDLNAVADKIIKLIDLFFKIGGYDPAKLEEIHKSFEFKPLFITYHGELDLTSGSLEDLSTLYRSDDVAISLVGSGDIVIKVPLGFEDLDFSYDYSAKLMNLGPTGSVEGKVTTVIPEIELRFNAETEKLQLESFKIVNAGKISLKFSGNILTDWLVNLFTSITTTVLHDLIIKVIENIVADNIDSILDLINGGTF